MKLLSFQPFALYENGGGNRILRRLYNNKESQVTSLAVVGFSSKPQTGSINEIIITAKPATQRWMRWYLRDVIIWLRESVFKFWTINRIRKAAKNLAYDVLHVVNHGPFSAALCTDFFCNGKQLWVSFHDHFSTTYSNFYDAEKLWNAADRRLVISKELGTQYQKLFGNKPYVTITDGVKESELSEPSTVKQAPVVIYFAESFRYTVLYFLFNAVFKTQNKKLFILVRES